MSLINDALKRATQTPSSTANPAAHEPQAPMQPVEYRRGSLPWYFFPTLLLILAGGVWFVVKGLEASRPAALTVHAREPQPDPNSAAPTEPSSSEMVAAGLVPGPSDNYIPPAQPPNRNFSLEDAPASEPAPTTATPATTTTGDPTKPLFKLQSIFFRPSNPSATVNGKNVSIGSRIGGATVTAITREGVTLDAQGQTTVLTLE